MKLVDVESGMDRTRVPKRNMRTVTLVAEIVNDREWYEADPLNEKIAGLHVFRVGIGDALDARDALTKLLPFVEEDYFPNCATPEFGAAMLHATRAIRRRD